MAMKPELRLVRSSRPWKSLVFACLASACGAQMATHRDHGKASTSTDARKQIDKIELSDLSNQPVNHAFPREKGILYTVFSTECMGCLRLLKQLQRDNEGARYSSVFDAVTVTVDPLEKNGLVARINSLNLDMPVYQTSIERLQAIFGKDALNAVPTSILVDKEGRVLHVFRGDVSFDFVARELGGKGEVK